MSSRQGECYVHYQDDGPNGPCGQDTRTTSNWSKLYVYAGPNAEKDAEAFIRYIRAGRDCGRRGARITAWWFEEEGHVVEGPIVQEADRV